MYGGKTFDGAHLYDTPAADRRGDRALEAERRVRDFGLGVRHQLPSLASADSGVTWTETTLPVPAGTQPRILASIQWTKKVYLRLLNGPSDAMAITADGGKTFQTVLTINGQLSSFLRAGDGAIYAGTLDGTSTSCATSSNPAAQASPWPPSKEP